MYCEDELRSLSEGEIQKLVEVSEESTEKILAGPIASESAGDELVRVDVVQHMEEGGQVSLNSLPVKNASGVENVAKSSKFPSEFSLNRSTGVAFKISEEEELLCDVAVSGKRRKLSNVGDGSKMAMSTGRLTR